MAIKPRLEFDPKRATPTQTKIIFHEITLNGVKFFFTCPVLAVCGIRKLDGSVTSVPFCKSDLLGER